jgi:type IV pilus assembly protein PilE
MSKNVQTRGFTLVELMVVIAIIAILMAVVVPSYQAQVEKTRRADAKATLMGESQRLERCFTDKDTYLGCEANDYNPAIVSYKGFYSISAMDGQNKTITTTTYTLTATPLAAGPQANDTMCKTLTINQLGEKTAADADGKDTSANCWQ